MPDIDTFTFNPNRVINAGEEITIRWNGERWQDQPVFGHSAMTITATRDTPARVTYNFGAEAHTRFMRPEDVEPDGELTAEDLRGEPARWGGFVRAPATIIRTAVPEPDNPLPDELAGENRQGANWRDMADNAEPGPEPGDEGVVLLGGEAPITINANPPARPVTLGEVRAAIHPATELKVELLSIAVREVEGTTAEALEYAKAYYEWVTQ